MRTDDLSIKLAGCYNLQRRRVTPSMHLTYLTLNQKRVHPATDAESEYGLKPGQQETDSEYGDDPVLPPE